MKTLSLKKQAALAPKFILSVDGLNLFLSEKQGLTGCNLTEDINKAQKFAVGFDNSETKAGIWTAELRRVNGFYNVSFKAVNI